MFLSGDPRRPYPTDLDMRCGFLGRINDLPISSQGLTSQASYSESLSSHGRTSAQMGESISQSNQLLHKSFGMMWIILIFLPISLFTVSSTTFDFCILG